MKSINILGFGTMGTQLAAFFHIIGYKVTVWNRSIPDAKLKRFSIEKRFFEKTLSCAVGKHDVVFIQNIEMLQPAITIEVLAEDLLIKREIVEKLPFDVELYGLFTNSSSFAPEEIHSKAQALHFFNPLHAVKLVETTSDSEAAPLFTDLQNAGITVVHTKMNRGFIANYVLFREIAAALMLVEKFGYDTNEIDQTLKALGRQSSIFDVVDFVGVDVTKKILENLSEADASVTVPTILNAALLSGILGKKNKTSIRTVLDQQNAINDCAESL